jgi:hypothetical protein
MSRDLVGKTLSALMILVMCAIIIPQYLVVGFVVCFSLVLLKWDDAPDKVKMLCPSWRSQTDPLPLIGVLHGLPRAGIGPGGADGDVFVSFHRGGLGGRKGDGQSEAASASRKCSEREVCENSSSLAGGGVFFYFVFF